MPVWIWLKGLGTAVKVAGCALVAVVILIAILLVMHRLSENARNAAAAANAHADKITAEAGDKLSSVSLEAVAGYGDRQVERQALDTRNAKEIHTAPGADVRVDPGLNLAGLRAACRREAYRASERCARLREADTAAATQAR